MKTVLETERLRLRRLVREDAEALYGVFADPYARRFYPRMEEPVGIDDWISWNLRNYNKFGFGLWVIAPKDDPRLIGDCGLTYQDVEGKELLEIGYHTHAAERGKGYATEAARAVLSYALGHLGADFVCSKVHPENTASRVVAGRVHDHRRDYLTGGARWLLYYTERPAPETA